MGVLTGGIWIKYLTIKICILDLTPEASGLNIQMSTISGMGRCKKKRKKGRWQMQAYDDVGRCRCKKYANFIFTIYMIENYSYS